MFELSGKHSNAGPMGLRLHFSADDLARLRVLVEPDPMWELVLSLPVLLGPTPARYVTWRRHALRALAGNDLQPQVRLLAALVAPRGDFPDFLTPPAEAGFEPALEAVLATPRSRLNRDLETVFTGRQVPSCIRSLASGEPESLASLGTAISDYQRAVIDPFVPEISDAVTHDRELRTHDLLVGGSERLLANLPHPIEWRSPVLHAAYPRDRDIHLGGRGLTLVPSYFCFGTPVTLIDAGLPPVLVYPAAHTDSLHGDLEGLSALLGRTRAQALASLRVPSTTTELALRSGMSVTSASKHATVLRQAGLIASTRRGTSVMHSLTRLGRELLDT
jgi:DNA-binding transcriptional ArsR family regulator